MKQVLYSLLFGLTLMVSACKSTQQTVTTEDLKAVIIPGISDENARSFDYFFLEAGRHKLNGDINKALSSYQKCLSYDPNSAVVYFEIGNIYLASNNPEQAINNYRRAVQLNPTNEWYQLFLASVYTQTKDNASAIKSYESLAKNFPSNLEYHYRLAFLYSQEKEYHKAIEKYNRVEELHGIDEALTLEKFKLYTKLGEEKNALKEVSNLVDTYPKQARYRILQGDAYLQFKNYKKSYKAYTEALKVNPMYGQAHLSLAGYYEQRGDSVQAIEQLKLAMKSKGLAFNIKMPVLVQVMMNSRSDEAGEALVEDLLNGMLNAYPDEAELHYYYGNYLLSKERKQEAIEQFNQVVYLDASHYDTWLQLAAYQMELENYDSLVHLCDEIIMHHPNKAEAYIYKGAAGFSLKDYQLALSAFKQGVKVVGKNKQLEGQFYANMGDAFHYLEQKDSAYFYYEKALVLDDHNVMVLNNYSYYLSEEGSELDKAERMSAKCVELEPGNSTYLDTYAWVLFKKKDYFLAKFYIEQAIDNMDAPNGVLIEHYGDILFHLDDKEKALEQWKKALDLESDGKFLKQKIERKTYIEE